jgi:hypothetical protein
VADFLCGVPLQRNRLDHWLFVLCSPSPPSPSSPTLRFTEEEFSDDNDDDSLYAGKKGGAAVR